MSLSSFPATRGDALSRLARFAPEAGHAYAAGRNTDPGPSEAGAVSKLSPYIRYRLITEQELVGAALGHHGTFSGVATVSHE